MKSPKCIVILWGSVFRIVCSRQIVVLDVILYLEFYSILPLLLTLGRVLSAVNIYNSFYFYSFIASQVLTLGSYLVMFCAWLKEGFKAYFLISTWYPSLVETSLVGDSQNW